MRTARLHTVRVPVATTRFRSQGGSLRPVYTKRQRQHCDNSAMTLANMFSLKSVELLENKLQPHCRVTPLFSMRTELQASSLSCRSVDADAWCKWSLSEQVWTGFQCRPPDSHRALCTTCVSVWVTKNVNLHYVEVNGRAISLLAGFSRHSMGYSYWVTVRIKENLRLRVCFRSIKIHPNPVKDTLQVNLNTNTPWSRLQEVTTRTKICKWYSLQHTHTHTHTHCCPAQKKIVLEFVESGDLVFHKLFLP